MIKDSDISRWTDWLVGRGDIPADKVTPADIYTNELNPYANGEAASGAASASASPSSAG